MKQRKYQRLNKFRAQLQGVQKRKPQYSTYRQTANFIKYWPIFIVQYLMKLRVEYCGLLFGPPCSYRKVTRAQTIAQFVSDSWSSSCLTDIDFLTLRRLPGPIRYCCAPHALLGLLLAV